MQNLKKTCCPFQSSRSLRTATSDTEIATGYRTAFQSSRSLRTATALAAVRAWACVYFNPRGPCGPRPLGIRPLTYAGGISILAVLADRDPPGSHLPGRSGGISILAVLADRDCWCYFFCGIGRSHFNPRGPCGPRPARQIHQGRLRPISILAVLADRDIWRHLAVSCWSHFNPRGPCGPRQRQRRTASPPKRFQSSRSLRTATHYDRLAALVPKGFQSSRSLRTATRFPRRGRRAIGISILAVLADRDNALPFRAYALIIFQSSRSLRTATSPQTKPAGP